MKWFKKTYQTWHGHAAARYREAELLGFISETAEKAIKNHWKEEVGR
ncbi:hypothetical protein J4443_00795 [Candidatus Woesearchaeota archaeon]|nr:hypothetical protein [Candidatus Woesearchaeota archaeon]